MATFRCSRRELVLAYIDGGKSVLSLTTFLRENYQVSENNIQLIVSDLQKSLISRINSRWMRASRHKANFLKKNRDWLDKEYCMTLPMKNEDSDGSTDCVPSTSDRKRGRPYLPFEDSAKSSKKRKNTKIMRKYGFDHIHSAYVQRLRSMRENDEATIVEIIRSLDANKKKSILKLIRDNQSHQQLSVNEALITKH